MSDVRLIASFADEEECAAAIAAAGRAGFQVQRTFAPFASEAIAAALQQKPSPVRGWILLGGVTGCAGGFWLTIGLSLRYAHRTAGMPIVSIPPFVIIAFELTILCGALAGVLGLLVHGGFLRAAQAPEYDPRFSDDRFGLVVACAAEHRPRAQALLLDAGAREIAYDAT
jgi:molybdopterin-containing oxidoreductase family membrane subunit